MKPHEYEEFEYLMLSGIQHFFYCQRQWAMIHIEKEWQENVHTVMGNQIHERAHDSTAKEKRGDLIITRGLRVASRTLGVSGECDVVEFHKSDKPEGAKIHSYPGNYSVLPVEYKKGKPKQGYEDIMQLTLEALCLEEMLSTKIDEGALYYFQTKSRQKVAITDDMKEMACNAVRTMHELMKKHHIPKSNYSKKCNQCSLLDICMPGTGKLDPNVYINRYIRELL